MKHLIATLLTSTTLAFAEAPTAIIVLDASGSMWGQIDGTAKIEIARDVIEDLLVDLPSDLELGLVAYGHRRKGDCEDIELLIPPGKVDRERFQVVVDNILPKGMTPLTDAVQFAAEGLNYKEEKASVILVTDGLETCDEDPCAVAKLLAQQGIDFTAHVVAFDLTAKDALTVECLATETGGQFLPAGDANSLATALGMAVEEVIAEPQPEEVEEEPAPEDPVTLTAPDSIPAGSKFEVTWSTEGKTLPNDFITIVPVDAKEGTWRNYSYTKDGSPVELKALPNPGQAEIRYLSGKTRNTLGRIPIQLTEIQASLEAPAEAVAGASVEITWTGPGYQGDFITIVPKDTEEKKWAKYAYTKKGENTVEVLCPPHAGPCEIRYLLGQDRRTLARRDITVTEAAATLSAPLSAVAGSKVTVEWNGPKNKGDFITIVTKDTPEKKWAKYQYATDQNNPAEIEAPMTPGPAEVRYLVGQNRETLARIDILIEKAEVSLSGPEKTIVGSSIPIEWTGPNNPGDFITVVPKNHPEKKWAKYAYTSKGSPLNIDAPLDAGEGEIRYLAGQTRETLARIPITFEAATVTLAAPDSVEAGTNVKIEWTGPDNSGDFITIVPKNHPEKKWAKYAYTRKGNPLDVPAPTEAGDYEIRYLAGQDRRTLHRIPIKVTPSTSEVE